MDIKAEFLRIMAEQTEIALATSVNNVPNVRIVNFYFCLLYTSELNRGNHFQDVNLRCAEGILELLK